MRSVSLSLLLLAAPLLLSACKGKDGDTGAPAAPNQKPVADAGQASTQTADVAVPLSGAGSSDPDGNVPLTYHWTFDHVPDGSALLTNEAPFSTNNSDAAITSGFIPDALGVYVVNLVVKDSKGLASDANAVIITITTPEAIPVAVAGTDQTTTVGTGVTLDGSRSYDPLGRALTYSWTLVDKPEGSNLSSISGSDSASGAFTPDARGVYVANLVVHNGLAPSNSDAIAITVTGDDAAPTANAGGDQAIEDCSTIALDCSASADPDGDTLRYLWELQAKPAGSALTNASFSDRTAARPTLYPDQAGVYVLTCSVFDGTTWSTPDLITLTADERRSNTRPEAEAGTDTTIDGGSAACTESGYTYNCDECAASTVSMGGGASAVDADGDPLTLVWTVVSGSATLTDPTSLTSLVLLEDAEPEEPATCTETDYEFELTVTDCTGASNSDSVTFEVSCCGVSDT